MTDDIAHDIECASAAYAVLIERAEHRGDRKASHDLRREWQQYLKEAIS